MKPVRAVIIGMGKMGLIRYNTMLEHGGFDIVAICDINEDSLKQYNIPYYTDWHKCLDEVLPEVAIVCTFNVFVTDIVCYALNHGIHVFSEKPPGRNLADVLKMKAAHDKMPELILKFGFNHRYHNSVIEAKALIDSKLLGDIVCARGVYGKAGSVNFAKEWRNDTSLSGGGILLDQGIHMLDLLRYFMGEFPNVLSSVNSLVWDEMETEDSVFAILKNVDGKMASIHSSAIQWKHKFDLDIICTDGYIALNGLLTSTKSYGEERISYYRKDLKQETGKIGNPIEHTMCFEEDKSWKYEIEEFYNALRFNKPITNGTINDAVRIMSLISDIYSFRN